ncbi:TIGR02391 family protein [Vulcanibacillus modesticaldus]|uniref:TIGR02391 family protein n=1 Tax=Vulcanibacillus modesticaldus TaxID=337097 RepID=A0A1D2YT13_9BACI|nr:TIGR02391 family protein [Vulcanibacillus modesticaldus]OEF98838.1 TIGR02391 family protein [Vulcanibacillus modesticaldus]
MIIHKKLNEQQLKAVCDVIADTNRGLTKTELSRLLEQCQIQLVDDGKSNNGYKYTIGLSKRDWLYNCFVNEINNRDTYERIYLFIEKALNPVAYTSESSREKYNFLFEGTNKALLMAGLSVSKEGVLNEVVEAKTLDEVDRRVNNLRRHLYNRAIHHEVEKYCIKDYLRKDYYDAVFEAAKGLAERVRQITGLTSDGSALFQKAFAKNDPYIFFNSLKSESEINEFIGLKELLESIFHLVRNPAAHTPKVNWKMDETKALDILTLISFSHKYLDECHKVPRS